MDDALRQLITLGRSYFERRQYGQAEKYLSQVVERNQSFADVYNMLGVIYHDQGQFARAQRSFEAALRLNPVYTEAALNLAIIYNDMGKYREAREVYQSALSRQRASPSSVDNFVLGKIANMYADIGDVWASSGRLTEAAAEYRRALEFCPSFVDIRLKLAGSARDSGDYDSAIRECEEIIRQNPRYIEARVHYGIALHSAGRSDDAVKVWEGVLADSPGHKSAEIYLHLVRGKDTDNEQAS